MSVTVSVDDYPGVRVNDQVLQAIPPDAVEFTVEGTVTVSGHLLGEFQGRRLRPVAVEVMADGSPVPVELSGGTAIDLDAVDVGVELRDAGDLPSRPGDLGPSTDDVERVAEVDAGDADLRDREGLPDAEAASEKAGVVAFTLTGTISGITPEAYDAIAAGPEAIESVTFAVEERRATDGGSADDVLVQFDFLGFLVAIRRDGTIVVGTA